MYLTDDMEDLKASVGRVFDNGGKITDTNEYNREFLNIIVEKLNEKLKISDFKYMTSAVTASQGFVTDIIEVDFKVKTASFPINTTKEFIDNMDRTPGDNVYDGTAYLSDYLKENLTEIIGYKTDIWIDVRAEGKKKRDVKILIYKRREVAVPPVEVEPVMEASKTEEVKEEITDSKPSEVKSDTNPSHPNIVINDLVIRHDENGNPLPDRVIPYDELYGNTTKTEEVPATKKKLEPDNQDDTVDWNEIKSNLSKINDELEKNGEVKINVPDELK